MNPNSNSRRAALLIVTLVLIACGEKRIILPGIVEIESTGLIALHGQKAAALDALLGWAQAGSPVAQRELGLAYAAQPAKYREALHWLEQAAAAGDVEAQFTLAEAYYKKQYSLAQDLALAWKYYQAAARQQYAKAELMLARMSKYGEGTAKNLLQATAHLTSAAEQGNAQAMFLLSNAYAAGEGVAQDQTKSRLWLERAAQADYPVAIQALALSLDAHPATSGADPNRARHLLKEAADERLLNWNKYQ